MKSNDKDLDKKHIQFRSKDDHQRDRITMSIIKNTKSF